MTTHEAAPAAHAGPALNPVEGDGITTHEAGLALIPREVTA
ncbi:hypothetical protein [Allorhizocola rhizosphaerae]|nr:hypothetical protein [Allorhizocola rhizosphaerae]